MAKKIVGFIKLQVPAGKANPSPPIGPALGQRGLNIMEFCKAFNAQTQGVEPGLPIPVVITAKVPAVYDFEAVKQQIREKVLAEYGDQSPFAKRGQNKLLYKRIYDLLVSSVQALQGESADLQVAITDPVESVLPEHFRYVSSASLTVTVEQSE